MPRGRKKKEESGQDEEGMYEPPIREAEEVKAEADEVYSSGGWVQVTPDEMKKLSKEQKLVGYDPKRGLALIKN